MNTDQQQDDRPSEPALDPGSAGDSPPVWKDRPTESVGNVHVRGPSSGPGDSPPRAPDGQSNPIELRDEMGGFSAAHSIPGYEILREIHRGGQGVVYQAVQQHTRRKVAIKVMKEGPFASKQDKARFEREVGVLGQLNHPGIVGVHDSGMASGNFYFVMDYISGQPLDVWMDGKEHPIEEALRLFVKICDAINATHLRGVVHRDLKPGNIRIDTEGEPHVLDFGLAKVATAADASLVTVTGQFVGTLPWASPEQAEGLPDKIDIRTDVYSLGVMLYQMLTGKFPYEVVGNIRDVLDRIIKAKPTPPSTIRRQIDDELETIILKCLSKERERRYQTAGELARDIGHYLGGEHIEAKRDSAFYVLGKNLRRHKVAVAVAVGFAVLLTLSTVLSAALWRQATRERDGADRQTHDAERAQTAEADHGNLAEAGPTQAEQGPAKAQRAIISRDLSQAPAQGEVVTLAEGEWITLDGHRVTLEDDNDDGGVELDIDGTKRKLRQQETCEVGRMTLELQTYNLDGERARFLVRGVTRSEGG